MASDGIIEVSYLTGAGRAADSLAVLISVSNFTDDQGNTVTSDITAPRSLTVSAYAGPSTIRTTVTFGASTNPTIPNTNSNSRLFRFYDLNIQELDYTTGGVLFVIPTTSIFIGSQGMDVDSTTSGAIGTSTYSVQQYPAYIRAFPGRISSATIRFDPNTWGVNTVTYSDASGNAFGPSNPRGVYEPAWFQSINEISTTTPLQGVLSDYLSFDISAMSDSAKPVLSTTEAGNVTAQIVYFSGDNYAISASGSSGNFYQLTSNIATNQYMPGTYSDNSGVAGYQAPTGLSATLPGTYALNEIDPSDPSFLRRIISLEGEFRPYSQMITTTGNVVAITFPGTLDNYIQDLVVLNRNSSGAIVDFYYGYIDLQARAVYLYPINTLVSATGTAITGTINPSNLYSSTGAVTADQTALRFGSFTLSAPLLLNNGNGTTTSYTGGTFNVFRR